MLCPGVEQADGRGSCVSGEEHMVVRCTESLIILTQLVFPYNICWRQWLDCFCTVQEKGKEEASE